jgi:Cu/Ag efflux pump CusA
VTHTLLNLGSFTGIIIIVGIIAENAIFTYYQFRQSDKRISFEERITYSIANRVRPKLMTVLTAIAMILPLSLGFGEVGPINQPLAVAMIGGLIFAIPLLLVVLPTALKFIGPEHPVSHESI